MNLDPLSLRLLVSVIEEGTIAATATREHIAAAAISKRFSELEDLLGVKLLVRTNKGISATAAGLYFAFMARGVLNGLDDLASQMKEFSDGERGTLHVLANVTAITQFLPSLVNSFMQIFPQVKIVLRERESLAITKGIAENRSEIGLFTRMPHDADIEVYPFRTDELKVLVPTGHPLHGRDAISFRDVLEYEQVVFRSGTHLNYQLMKAASDAGRPLRAKIEVSTYDALCLMVQAGVGLAILPGKTAEIYRLHGARAIALTEPWAKRDLVIGVRSVASLSPVGRLFFDHLMSS